MAVYFVQHRNILLWGLHEWHHAAIKEAGPSLEMICVYAAPLKPSKP